MSAARSSHGGEEPRRREKKEKDKDKEKDAEKKEKSHHIKRSTTKELTESLKPSSEQVRTGASYSFLSRTGRASRLASIVCGALQRCGRGTEQQWFGGERQRRQEVAVQFRQGP